MRATTKFHMQSFSEDWPEEGEDIFVLFYQLPTFHKGKIYKGNFLDESGVITRLDNNLDHIFWCYSTDMNVLV